jgi:hypothetical protein
MLIEIIHAVGTGGDIARTHRIQQLVRADIVPPVPDVEFRRRVGGDVRRVEPLDDDLLARRDGDRVAAGGDDRGPTASPGDERGAFSRHVHAIVAGMLDGEGRVWRVHFHRVARIERPKIK